MTANATAISDLDDFVKGVETKPTSETTNTGPITQNVLMLDHPEVAVQSQVNNILSGRIILISNHL